jgi:hypothetical protein
MTRKIRKWEISLCIIGKTSLIYHETSSILHLTGNSPLIFICILGRVHQVNSFGCLGVLGGEVVVDMLLKVDDKFEKWSISWGKWTINLKSGRYPRESGRYPFQTGRYPATSG